MNSKSSFYEQVFSSLWIVPNPEARIYYLNLLSSLFIAWLIIYTKKSGAEFFSKKYWLHQSSLTDIKIFFFNAIFRTLFIAPWLISSLVLSNYLTRLWYQVHPSPSLEWTHASKLFFYTALSFVISDFFRFIMHFFMHKVPLLWRFHQVHHSAEVLTPFTLYRNHPIEVLLAQARNVIAISLASSFFLYLFQSRIGGIDILGVNALGFMFNLIGSNLRHSPLKWGWGVLEYLFISPAQHQLHHAKEKEFHDKNFGVCLSIWDQLLGSFMKSSHEHRYSFGIHSAKLKQTLIGQLFLPFK